MCTEKYINPFTDFGFKRLFGTVANKHFLINFLNSLIGFEDPIIDIKYHNIEQLGIKPEYRVALYDLYCKTESGTHIIVELQNGSESFFVDRSVFYSSFLIQDAAEKGDWNFELPKIYTVALLNFNLKVFENDQDFKHIVKLTDQKTKAVIYNKLTYVYLEMKKFKKEIDLASLKNIEEMENKDSISDIWVYIIKHLDQFDKVPETLKGSLFEKFFKEAEILAFTPEERQAYETSLKAWRVYNNTINTAKEEGVMEEKKAYILQMLDDGLDINTMARYSRISVDKVKQILEEIKRK